MLLIVGWSAVVVWLNVRSGMGWEAAPWVGEDPVFYLVGYGCPWTWGIGETSHPSQFASWDRIDYLYSALTANIAIGLLAVAVLRFASKYLARAIVAGLRAFLSKPPPSNAKGHQGPNQGI